MPSPSYWPIVLAFGLPIIAYGIIFNRVLAVVGGADRPARRCSGGRSSRRSPTTPTTTRRPTTAARARSWRPLADLIVHSPERRRPDRARREPRPARTVTGSTTRTPVHVTSTGPQQQQAGDVDVPRQRVPAVRRPDLHVHAVPRPPLGADLGPDQIYDIPFTSVSCFVLLMSSLTMVLAVSAARAERRPAGRRCGSSVTALLGSTFVGGQVYEFTSFYREGLGFTTSLFGSSFYTLTGFHGVHVTVGIIMLMALVGIISRSKVPGQQGRGRRARRPLLALRRHRLDHHLHPRLPDPVLSGRER